MKAIKRLRIDPHRPMLVVIGASAGGPSTVARLLEKIPLDFKACIVVVQHFDSKLTDQLVEWWSSKSNIKIAAAKAGDTIVPGKIYIASGDKHLVLKENGTLDYEKSKGDYSYTPSIDHFFCSVAQNWKGRALGVVLTGMGDDGTDGLHSLKSRGFQTVAESKDSAAIYGMPKSAFNSGAAEESLHLDQIIELIKRQGAL